MEVQEAIRARGSVRSYLPKRVPKDKLERVLDAARHAPSAMNLQPWHFIVVTDSEKRRKLSEGGMFAWFLAESPVVVVGCGNRRLSSRWYAIDTAIAMQNMVLAATGEGLGTCWVGSFDEEQVRKLLEVPGEFSVVALLAVGYAREELDFASGVLHAFRRKKELGQIASLERFGNRLEE